MKFNSQVYTDKNQSERLLALGLKKETADMALHFSCMDMDGNEYYIPYTIGHQCTGIPAWSLHRLIEMTHKNTIDNNAVVLSRNQTYDQLIGRIARQIKEGYFNKEYLV